MSATTIVPEAAAARPRARLGLDWCRGLFGTATNAAITLGYAAVFWWVLLPPLRWASWDATWFGTADTCRAGSGACWAFVGEKLRFILFGFYPAPLQWRPALACLLLVTVCVALCVPRLWGRALLLGAVAGVVASVLVLLGWPVGPIVSTQQWGGLPVTLLLSLVALAGAFPLAVLLAIGRRSRRGPVRLLAITYVEVVRGVPFIAILYLATLLFPLMLPQGASIDKFARAQVALILFVAAYMAEIVRAGLQSLPAGQTEAGRALGLREMEVMRLVTLPQALRAVIPSMVNLAIGIFQETTLVLVIGMFDLLNTARAANTDMNWLGFVVESFLFIAAIYFASCFALSRYSLRLERHLSRSSHLA